jgi:hypothetical protein
MINTGLRQVQHERVVSASLTRFTIAAPAVLTLGIGVNLAAVDVPGCGCRNHGATSIR